MDPITLLVVYTEPMEAIMHHMVLMAICTDPMEATMDPMEQVVTTCMDHLKVTMHPMDQMATMCTDQSQELMSMDHTTTMESMLMSIAILPKDPPTMVNKETP